MKPKWNRKALLLLGLIAALCCIICLFRAMQPVGKECFRTSYTAENAGYYTLSVDCSQVLDEDHTLSVYINHLFSRKAAFRAGGNETVCIPVYLQKGKNEISFKQAQGDLETKIDHVSVAKRDSATKMVFAPHEDDETLAFAGSIMHMLEAGDDVLVVLVSNGDWISPEMGKRRLVESAEALAVMGLPRENLIIMGYPDSLIMPLFNAQHSRKILKLENGESYTYGNPEYQLYDFHTLQHGKAAPTNGRSIREDFLWIFSACICPRKSISLRNMISTAIMPPPTIWSVKRLKSSMLRPPTALCCMNPLSMAMTILSGLREWRKTRMVCCSSGPSHRPSLRMPFRSDGKIPFTSSLPPTCWNANEKRSECM